MPDKRGLTGIRAVPETHPGRRHQGRLADSAGPQHASPAGDPVLLIICVSHLSIITLACLLQCALWNCCGIDVYQHCFYNILHACSNGVTSYLIDSLLPVLVQHFGSADGHRRYTAINDRLKEVRKSYKANVPTDAMQAPRLEGNERAGILKFLPQCCHGLAPAAITEALLLYARFVQLRDAAQHNSVSIRKLEGMLCEVVQAIPAAFTNRSWGFPKFFQLRYVIPDLVKMGTLRIVDTGPKERAQKDVREAYHRTKREREGLHARIASKTAHLERMDASLRAMVRRGLSLALQHGV